MPDLNGYTFFVIVYTTVVSFLACELGIEAIRALIFVIRDKCLKLGA